MAIKLKRQRSTNINKIFYINLYEIWKYQTKHNVAKLLARVCALTNNTNWNFSSIKNLTKSSFQNCMHMHAYIHSNIYVYIYVCEENR